MERPEKQELTTAELEARLLRNPELVERIQANRVDPSRMKRRRSLPTKATMRGDQEKEADGHD